MPSWREKMSEDQARGLVQYVRAFASTTEPPKGAPRQPSGHKAGGGESARTSATSTATSSVSLDERSDQIVKILHEVQTQIERLENEVRELHPEGGTSARGSPSHAPTRPPISTQQKVSRPHARATAEGSDVREMFEQRCAKCHGADGTGKASRGRLPQIPDFTKGSWQVRRNDPQLLTSILDGKDEMPSWSGKISLEQARSLVGYVRTLAPIKGKSEQEKPKGPASPKPGETARSNGFLGKLIRWLGKFHPVAVHFPVALLTTAAVAEFLRMVTGKDKRALDAVSRYCVWFGALTAVVAGSLGWCLGGFRLPDASWIKMTHRCLGTSTVAFAGLVLVLSERSCHPDRQRTRTWFRVMLFVVAGLVLVTGFFGGALVFGLKHYAWPR
jgi:mono/diheme cytochrome c family protein/uncharacterized membrane protein